MNTWDQLITEQQRLNSIASNIQGFSIDENGEPQIKIKLDKTEVSKFVNDYLSWYSDCLVLLPDDLSERFRSEYENKVKAFIIEPTIFDYKEHKDEYDHSYFEGYFKYDYSTYFYPAFFTHRQILLEASRRLNKPATTPTVFEAVEVIERLVHNHATFSETER